MIKTIEECEKALLRLGYQVSGKSIRTRNFCSIPSGCSIRNNDNQPYFSTCEKGRRERDHIPICSGLDPDLGNIKYICISFTYGMNQ